MSVAAIGSLDDDELRVVQGAPDKIPFPPTHDAARSSIASVEAPLVPQHRPLLSPPRNVLLDVIDAHLMTENLAHQSAQVFDAEVKESMKHVETLNAEKQEALQQEYKAAEARKTWSTFAHVSQYFASMGALVLGASTLAISTVTAALLISAGGLGLIGRLLHDTNLMEKITAWCTESTELQAKIARNIEMGMFYLQMGLGLASGFAAWQTGVFAVAQSAGAQAIIQKVSTIVTGASGVMTTGSRIGMAIYNKKVADMQAKIKELNGRLTTDEQTMYQNSSQMGRMIDLAQSQTEEVRKAIQAFQISAE